ncbi:MAG: hypothetical protein Q7J98_06900 [Kiritimatiellia bacterium]|nr:hypothetical protein [Kiritimatiellia bacterium]
MDNNDQNDSSAMAMRGDIIGPVLRTLNELKLKGLLTDYAIGGGVAVLYYAEPVLTYDFDVVCVLPRSAGALVDPTPVYQELKRQGFCFGKEDQIMIAGVPVQFIPADDGLLSEALTNARKVVIDGVPTRIITLEYLVANMLKLYRPKDRAKLDLIVNNEAVPLDQELLEQILHAHGLLEKWGQFHER